MRVLTEAGYAVGQVRVVPDGAESVETALRSAVAEGAHLILTTGGTGVSPRDLTPEGTARVLERELPGVAEEVRRRGALQTPTAVLTRGLVGTVGAALVINAPGSPAAVASALEVVLPLASHVLDQLAGGDH